MDLAVKRKMHQFYLKCEEKADKMIKRGVAPWRAREAACKIDGNRPQPRKTGKRE